MPIYPRKNRKGEEFLLVTVSGVDRFGRRHQLTRHATKKKPAEKLERQLYAELHQLIENGPVITFGAFLPEYLNYIENKRKKTKGSVDSEKGLLEKHALPYFKDLPIAEIRTKNIDFILDEVLNNHSSQTRKHALNYLRAFFELAIRRDLVRENPCNRVERIKVAHKAKIILNREQIRKFLIATKEYYPEWYPLLLTIVHCAFRAGEARGLKWGDITWSPNADIIHLRRVFNVKGGIKDYPKNKEPRPVPISTELKEELLKIKSQYAFDDDDWVFERLTEFMRSEQAKVVRAICRIAGVPECTFHQLRAAAITNYFNEGIDLGVIKKIAGHKRLSSTDIYYHASGEIVKGRTKDIRFTDSPLDQDDTDGEE